MNKTVFPYLHSFMFRDYLKCWLDCHPPHTVVAVWQRYRTRGFDDERVCMAKVL